MGMQVFFELFSLFICTLTGVSINFEHSVSYRACCPASGSISVQYSVCMCGKSNFPEVTPRPCTVNNKSWRKRFGSFIFGLRENWTTWRDTFGFTWAMLTQNYSMKIILQTFSTRSNTSITLNYMLLNFSCVSHSSQQGAAKRCWRGIELNTSTCCWKMQNLVMPDLRVYISKWILSEHEVGLILSGFQLHLFAEHLKEGGCLIEQHSCETDSAS